MKKFIFLFICLNAYVFGESYSLKAIDTGFCENNKESESISEFEYDEEGYLIKYISVSKNKDGQIEYQKECNLTRVDGNKIVISSNIFLPLEQKNYTSTKEFLYKENFWVLKNTKDDEKLCIKPDKKEISFILNSSFSVGCRYSGNKFEIFYSDKDPVYSLRGKKGFFNQGIDELNINSDNECNQFDALDTIEKRGNKYYAEDYCELSKTVFEIETNYNFKSWKSAAINFYIVRTVGFITLPYALGFGNGFQFEDEVRQNNMMDNVLYSATSFLTEGNATYEPEHLQQKDGLPWASGNGKGIGDVISIKEFEHKNPKSLKIINGYQDKNHPNYYDKNSRVKTIKITNAETKKSKTITVKDIKDEQIFSVKELGDGQNYDVEILDVYEGNKYKDLCIQYLILE